MKKILTHALVVLLLTALITPAFAISLSKPDEINSSAIASEPVTIDKAKADAALSEFKNLSKHERKDRIKEAKIALKQYRKNKAEVDASSNTLLLVILAIILPPVAVLVHEGGINNKFWLDLLLTILGFLPGIIYALIVVLKKD